MLTTQNCLWKKIVGKLQAIIRFNMEACQFGDLGNLRWAPRCAHNAARKIFFFLSFLFL